MLKRTLLDSSDHEQSDVADLGVIGRHVPGSQPPYSLIADPDQNKKDKSFISVVAYGVYIPLLRPIQFCLLSNRNF